MCYCHGNIRLMYKFCNENKKTFLRCKNLPSYKKNARVDWTGQKLLGIIALFYDTILKKKAMRQMASHSWLQYVGTHGSLWLTQWVQDGKALWFLNKPKSSPSHRRARQLMCCVWFSPYVLLCIRGKHLCHAVCTSGTPEVLWFVMQLDATFKTQVVLPCSFLNM